MGRRPAPARPAPARPASRPASTKAAPAPQQQSNVPAAPQPQQSGGMLSSIGSTIAQGMAFGTGSAIAHRAVGAVAESMSGSGSSEQPVAAAPEYAQGAMDQSASSMNVGACASDKQMYYDCVKDNRDDQVVCNFLLEQLKSCQQNQMYSG